MVLCEIKKFDDKCRIQIPTHYVKGAGGNACSSAYVMFDERTHEITIKIKQQGAENASDSRQNEFGGNDNGFADK